MTDPLYPTLPGLTWSAVKTPNFNTITQKGASGRQVRVTNQLYPIWQFTLKYGYLRDKWDARATGKGRGTGKDELRTLVGAFLLAYGAASNFLFDDPTDDSITAASIGTGDGTTLTFQLARAYAGGFSEPITAPNVVSHVYVNGVDPGGWSVNPDTGVVTMGAAPGLGLPVTADFTYYFRCHFMNDSTDFENFVYQVWEAKEVKFESVLL